MDICPYFEWQVEMSYIGLHVHTEFSNLKFADCIIRTPRLFERCKELSMPGVAITDHDALSSHISAIQTLKDFRKKAKDEYEKEQTEENKANLEYWNNFKLILGNEIYLVRNDLTKENYNKEEEKYYHFILLAKDEIGHKQLRELSSRAWGRSFRQFIERVPTHYKDIEEVIGNEKGHLVASTACLGSYFAKLICDYIKNQSIETVEKLNDFVVWGKKWFGEDFYIELQPSASKDQNIYNEYALRYAKKNKLKTIITTDAHYLLKEDRIIHEFYLNANDGDREVAEFYTGTYIQTPEEIKSFMYNINEQDINNMLQETINIGNKVVEYNLSHKSIIPKMPIEKVSEIPPKIMLEINEREYINKFINSPDIQDKHYIANILIGLKNKVEKTQWQEYLTQIELELKEVWGISEKIENKMSSYFNLVVKILDIIWNEGDSIVGVSRGSAAGYVTNYLLGIVQCDPIKLHMNNIYWRFITSERPELPRPRINWATIKIGEPC